MANSWKEVSNDLMTYFDVNYNTVFTFCSIVMDTKVKEKSLEEIRKIFNNWDDQNRDLLDKKQSLMKKTRKITDEINQINRKLIAKGGVKTDV